MHLNSNHNVQDGVDPNHLFHFYKLQMQDRGSFPPGFNMTPEVINKMPVAQ